MNFIVPFRWNLSSQKLKKLNSCLLLKKYLGTIEGRKLYVKLYWSTPCRKSLFVHIQGTKYAKIDSLIEFFRAVPLTRLDCRKIETFKKNRIRSLNTAVKKEVNQENRLIIKGKFKFDIASSNFSQKPVKEVKVAKKKVTNDKCNPVSISENMMDFQVAEVSSCKDVSIRENSVAAVSCVSTLLPNVELTCHFSQKLVANSNIEKQQSTNDRSIFTSIPENTIDVQFVELSKDLGKMYNNSACSDVIITCQSQQFRAHKVILKARCPDLLLDSLKNDPFEKEAIANINLDHLPVLTVTTLLFYIYTGKLELTCYLACDLIYVANLYSLKKLKDVCMDFLVNVLNEENVLFIYSFSCSFDEILKQHALLFIFRNSSSILTSTVWEQLKRARPDLSLDILSEMVKYKTPPLIDLTLE